MVIGMGQDHSALTRLGRYPIRSYAYALGSRLTVITLQSTELGEAQVTYPLAPISTMQPITLVVLLVAKAACAANSVPSRMTDRDYHPVENYMSLPLFEVFLSGLSNIVATQSGKVSKGFV